MIYFAFAVADSMFPPNCVIKRREITPKQVKSLLEKSSVAWALNPSHAATVNAAKSRFGLPIQVPAAPPVIKLAPGDKIIVMSVRGLPRLTDRHEYSDGEIASAQFSFSVYEVAE